MLRVVGLALLLVGVIAVPAAAAEGHPGAAAATFSPRGMATRGGHALAQQPAPSEPLAGAAGALRWSAWAPWTAGLRRDLVIETASLPARPPEHRGVRGAPVVPWLRQDLSGLKLTVTKRLAFGVDYRHLQGEDLPPHEAGPLDRDSHDFLLRAHWHF